MNSYYITIILIHLIVPAVVSIPLLFRTETSHKNNTFVYSKLGVGVGVFGIVAITAINILMLCVSNDTLSEKMWLSVGFQSFNLLGVASILIGLNRKIELKKEEMLYRNFLGISRTYKYTDIEKMVFYYYKNSKIIEKVAIYSKKRRFEIDCYFHDFNEIIRILRVRIKTNKNCVVIEKNKKLE